MSPYHSQLAAVCGDCAHFRRHYIKWDEDRYVPLHLGHCVFPRLKDRREEEHCIHWMPISHSEGEIPPKSP